MCRVIFIVGLFLGGAIGSLYAQGKWVTFVAEIDGKPPQDASMLNQQYGFVQTVKGLYRTTDGGKNWVLMKGAQPLWGGFYYYTPANIFVGGYAESTDSGRTWKNLPVPAAGGQMYIKDGIFYDAAGRASLDHGKTWDTINKVSSATREVIVGNLDQNIAIWGGSGGIVDSTIYTTDGGRSWQIGASGVESDYGYAIPHSYFYFRAGGDGTDAIQRSSDGGASWKTVYGPIHQRFLSDGIGGDGCVVFVQTMSAILVHDTAVYGLLRSTDIGQTWTAILGPVSHDDSPLCGVTSRGAVCFAMSFQPGDPVMEFIDSSILRPALADTKITRLFPDTVVMDECDSTVIGLQIGFSACDYIRLHNLRIDSLASKYYRTSFTLDKIIHEGDTNFCSITFLPNAPGIYHLQAHISIAASDWTGSDTTLPFILIVKSDPPILEIDRKDSIDFGTKPLCLSGGRDTILLSNPSCEAMKITNVRLDIDFLSSPDFTLTTVTPYTLQRGKIQDKIILYFHPQTSGMKSGKIIIESTIGKDTISFFANVLPDDRILHVHCDSLLSPLCDSVDGVFHLANFSCRRMILDSFLIPSPCKLLPFQFPRTIDPGDSAILSIRFLPRQRGSIQIPAVAKLRYFLPLSTIAFDTSLSVTTFTTHGNSSYLLSSLAAIFDTLHLCDSASRRIVLYSTGCDSLPLRSISVSGDPDFQVSGIGVRSSEVATGDSIVVDISLNPTSIGNKSATITLTVGDSTFTIPLAATVIRPLRLLSSDATALMDFGKQLTCQNSDTIITLHNPGCDTVRVSDARFQGSGFESNTSFPVIIPPGGSKTIDVQTLLDTSGGTASNSSQLTFTSDADTALPSITLSRSYIYPHPVHLWLDAGPMPLTASGIWKVKLKAWPSEVTDVHTIDLALSYNADLLGYLPNLSSMQSSDGKNFHLNGISVKADSTIGEMAFAVYLTKETETNLVMSNVLFNGDPKFTECVAIPQSEGVGFTYLNSCGDLSIRSFMLGQPLQLSIRPNPVKEEIILELKSNLKQDASIEIFDALGVKVFSDSRNLLSGSNTIHLPTGNYSQGMYVVRINAPNGSISQSFVKMK